MWNAGPTGRAGSPSARSKTDPTGEGAVVAITAACIRALHAIRPENPEDQGNVFQLADRQIANRIKAACHAAGLDGDAFSGHSGRVGLNQSQGGMCIWLVVGVGMGVMQEPFGS